MVRRSAASEGLALCGYFSPRLGVVRGALVRLVAGAGAAGRGVFSLSVAWRGGVMPAERRAESIS